ncbi:hypothetical protein K474DRAFT_1641210 [Panus rudis PR-1116 ss-1]|nr:hypothetical protein K474DRAFT_1641210 [Panus rudis PR-1116 ss-1]
MHPKNTFEESIALLDSERGSEETLGKPETSFEQDRATHRKPAIVAALGGWVPVIVISCIFFDLAAFFYLARLLLDNTAVAFGELEVRNTYVGMDELYSLGIVNSSQYPPMINRPRVNAHVSKAEPNKVFPVDELREVTDAGRVSPPDRRLIVSGDVTTIAQFRVLDFGMERCQLAISLPRLGQETSHPFVFQGNPDTGVRLDVYELQADKKLPLEAAKLSWRSKPKRGQRVGTIVARPGAEEKLPEFPCKWGEHHAFEVTCAGGEKCMIDARAALQSENWGVYMYQYQTI